MIKGLLTGMFLGAVLIANGYWFYWMYKMVRHDWTTKGHQEQYWWCPGCWFVRGFAKIGTMVKRN